MILKKKLSDDIKKVKQSLSSLNFNFSNYIFEKKYVYSDFNDKLNNLNTNIQKIITELNNLKSEIINLLSEKEKNTFKDFTDKKIEMNDLIDELNALKNDCNNLVRENNDYTEHIDENKEDAKNKLIQNELLDFNLEYELSKKEIDNKKEKFKMKKKKEKELELQINKLKNDKTEKLKMTKNEQLAADFINKYLGDYFRLEKISNQHNYIVKNIDGTTRPVSTLSKGEKNIVAFLWFIKNLENIELNNNKKKIVIFDDPMDSNDDVMQYIMLSELSKLTDMFRSKKIIENNNNNNIVQLFIFTHNAHFYMNIKENLPHGNTNYKSIILRKNNKITIEEVTKDNDIKQNYDVLWQDAIWLFDCDKPNLLLNNFRRIIESYITFNKIDKYDFYSKIDSLDFKKLLDTNSHFVSEEMDSNPFTREELLKEFKNVFKKNDDFNHFKNHWETNKKS